MTFKQAFDTSRPIKSWSLYIGLPLGCLFSMFYKPGPFDISVLMLDLIIMVGMILFMEYVSRLFEWMLKP